MTQTELTGKGCVKQLPHLLNKYDVRSIFLVTGKESYISSGAKEVLDSLLQDYKIIQFSDFDVNPKIEDVIRGIRLATEEKPDVIIAVGGGSVIDIAKLINVIPFQEYQDCCSLITGDSKVLKRGLPFFAIPTTSGTGSEATHFAVVYINDTKFSLAHEFVLPNYSIVDPVFTYRTPAKLTAIVGMDALSQAIESYWAVKSNQESKAYASEAISLILSSLVEAVSSEENARDVMSEAAHLAGKAINITTTTAPHALSYPITTYFGIPHGHAVALTVGNFFEINSDLNNNIIADPRGSDYLINTMHELFAFFGVNTAKECRLKWYKLLKKIGLEIDIRQLGIRTPLDVQKIVNNVNLQRLENNPVKVIEDTLVRILSHEK